MGVINLFKAGEHDSVILVVNTLGGELFESKNLRNVAIREAFDEGARNGVKDIVEEFHEHPSITPGEYADGLIVSWNCDHSRTIFPILLSQADQGDLEEVKKRDTYKENQEFREAIDDAISKAEHAGARHDRFLNKERVKLAKEAFVEIEDLEFLAPKEKIGGIIESYHVDESEGTESGKGQLKKFKKQ